MPLYIITTSLDKIPHYLLMLVCWFWQIEYSNNENIKQIKEFLVKLSGRLVQRGKVSISPIISRSLELELLQKHYHYLQLTIFEL